MTLNWPSNLDAAIWYGQHGLRPFPCFELGAKGQCTCGTECGKNAGKHPRVKQGFKVATTNLTMIRHWWKKWPNANIGIATGNGLFVIDVDPRNGGDESFAQLEAELGAFPKMFEVKTGGGGRQFYCRIPEGTTIKSSNGYRPGIDIRGEGGYVIAPPSNHRSGGVYTWASTGDENAR